MRAVQMRKFGGPEVLRVVEADEPTAEGDEVLVEVEAAEVMFLDVQLRTGWGQEYFQLELPIVPGPGVAGLVRTPAGVERVIAGTGGVGEYRGGGYAERAAVPASEVFSVPAGLALTDALAALHDGATAVSQMDLASAAAPDRVLVTGAAGSLGGWLIPLLKANGATVVAAARGERKLRYAEELGADEVVDYSEPGWTGQVRPVDVVFDGVGGEIGRAAFGRTRDGGRFHAYGAASGDFAGLTPERGIELAGLFQPDPEAWRASTRRALDHLATGRVLAQIGAAFPLAEAAAAHRAIESRTTVGKTLLLTR